MSSEILRQLRAKKSLTQNEMAKIFGISNITYMKWEKGETEPKFSQMVKALKVLDADIKDVFIGLDLKTSDTLEYNLSRAELLSNTEKECLNHIVDAMLLKHQVEAVKILPRG